MIKNTLSINTGSTKAKSLSCGNFHMEPMNMTHTSYMYRGPQLLGYTLMSDLFSDYRTYFSEFLNETITIKVYRRELHLDQ